MASKYKLIKSNLELGMDLAFIDSLLEAQNLEAEPEVRRLLLDITYTLARDKLMEARRFADLANKFNIDVADIQIAKIDQPAQKQVQRSEVGASSSLPSPLRKTSLMLPPWRNCQVGANVELKDMSMDGKVVKRSVKVAGATPAKLPRMRNPNQFKKQ